MITAYPAVGEVLVLPVGEHDAQNPSVDVDRTLYDALDLDD